MIKSDEIDLIWDEMDYYPIIQHNNSFEYKIRSSVHISKIIENEESEKTKKICDQISNFILKNKSYCKLKLEYSIYLIPEISKYFLDLDKTKFKCVFYCPPIHLQEIKSNSYKESQFLSHSYYTLRWLINFLNQDGFIIVHAIESTYSKFRILLDKIFGRNNHIATIIWRKGIVELSKEKIMSLNSEYIKSEFDYIIIYSKNIDKMKFYKLPPDLSTYSNPDNDPRGPWHSMPLVASQKSSNKIFTYTFKNGVKITKKFRYPFHSIKKLEEENMLHYTSPKGRPGIPRVKKFYKERLDEFRKTGKRGLTPNSLWTKPENFGTLLEYWQNLNFNSDIFSITPYRVPKLYEKILEITTKKNDSIFDYFNIFGELANLSEKLKRKYVSF